LYQGIALAMPQWRAGHISRRQVMPLIFVGIKLNEGCPASRGFREAGLPTADIKPLDVVQRSTSSHRKNAMY